MSGICLVHVTPQSALPLTCHFAPDSTRTVRPRCDADVAALVGLARLGLPVRAQPATPL
jgi:hypothetical protein